MSLNTWENHQTDTEFDDQLTAKVGGGVSTARFIRNRDRNNRSRN
jgi:hypothetical protein